MIKSKIIPKINRFIDNLSLYKSFDGIFNYMVKHNIISVNIHDIVNGRKNKRKFILATLHCLYLWLFSYLLILFIVSDKLIDLFDNPWLPFDQIRLLLILNSVGMFMMANIRTDFLKEEKRNNLIWLKFIYYLMMNDQLNHKFNYHNYKIMKIIIKSLHFIIIEIVYPITILFLFIVILISMISQSFILIILLPFTVSIYYIFLTSLCGILSLTLSTLVYYLLRFNQINTQLRLFHKLKTSSLQTINRTINEHNQLSLAIQQLNLTLNKTIGWLFIMTAITIDLLIYMLIYTKSIYYKLYFLLIFVGCFALAFILDFLLIKISNSAHQSYNLMYSIIQRPTISYRTRYKVKLKKVF